MRAACHENARGFALEKPMPKNRPRACFRSDIAKRRTRKPCAIKKTFQYRGHSHPPYRINNYEMVCGLESITKALQVRLEFLLLPIALVKNGVELHFPDIHARHVMTCLACGFFVGIRYFSAHPAFIWMAEKYEYFLLHHVNHSVSNSPTSSRLPTFPRSIARKVFMLK